jgi:hypothetical protein
MVANDDAHKPIWLSEVGWNAVLDADLPPEQITQYGEFGLNTQDEAARWTPIAYQRAAEEWPWIGHISYWFFTRADPSEVGQASYYFRMVEPDYSPEDPTFTPLPVYNAMQQYITERTADPVLYQGVHQAESWEIDTYLSGTPTLGEVVSDESAQFGDAVSSSMVDFTAYGTQVTARVKVTNEGVSIQRDGEQVDAINMSDDWQTVILSRSLLPQQHDFRLASIRVPFLIDSITIEDRTFWNVLPFVITVFGLVVTISAFAYWAWQRHRRRRRRSLR